MNPSEDTDSSLDSGMKCKSGVLTKKEVFRWSIFSGLILNPRSGVRSDYFSFSPARNSKFCLLLESDPEKGDIYGNQFGVCLQRFPPENEAVTDSESAIKVSFSLLDIRDRLHHTCERTMRQCDKVYGHFDRSIVEKHQLMLFRKGTLTINCALDVEEVVSEEEPQVLSNGHLKIPFDSCGSRDLIDDLTTLLDSQKLTDVILSVDGKDFQVHRAILAARSPVFAAMFEHDTLEKMQNRVVIQDISSDVLPALLRYLYSSEIHEMSPSTCLSLFIAADKYSLPKLKKLCSSFLCANLTTEMVLSVLTVASMHGDPDLQEAAIRTVLENAMHVMKTDDWLSLLKEHSEIANSIILRLAMRK